jgi:hypothetical protein
MLIDKITVDCIQQSATFGTDTLVFKLNNVQIRIVEISSGELKEAGITDEWIVEEDTNFTVELKNLLFPNKELLRYIVTQSDIDKRYFNLEINDGCNYKIYVTL